MRAAILQCRPGYQFHFGNYAVDSNTALSTSSEIIHSDTLFSALVLTYRDMFPEDTDDFVHAFEIGKIRISSANFCLQQGDQWVWFLPKPLSFDLAKVTDAKHLKRIKYISKRLWEIIEHPSELIEDEDIVIVQQRFALHRSELHLAFETGWDDLKVYYSQVLPKVQVRKPKQEDNLYQLNTIEIPDNLAIAPNLLVHYYFLYEITEANETLKSRFDLTLDLLGMSGIGAERSTMGQLNGAVQKDWHLQLPTEESFSCTASLVSPGVDEIRGLRYYRSMFRGGRRLGVGQLELKSLRMLEEGSILKRSVTGEVHDITPDQADHMVFKRNGKAFHLPIRKSWLL